MKKRFLLDFSLAFAIFCIYSSNRVYAWKIFNNSPLNTFTVIISSFIFIYAVYGFGNYTSYKHLYPILAFLARVIALFGILNALTAIAFIIFEISYGPLSILEWQIYLDIAGLIAILALNIIGYKKLAK